MSTELKLKEEFLTCIICHEVFRDPVTLHCGHTFCAQCITAYTETQKQAIVSGNSVIPSSFRNSEDFTRKYEEFTFGKHRYDKDSIPCPNCRELTKVPDPKQPVTEWARQMKTGLFVKGLVETFIEESADDVHCTVCKDDGLSKPAKFHCSRCKKNLCSDCEKYHKKFLDGHKVEDFSVPAKPKRKGQLCSEHANSYIDMFCMDCDKALCQICCIVYHRKCESIIPLKQAVPKFSSVLQNERMGFDKAIEDLERNITVKKFQSEELDTSAKKAETGIKTWIEKIISQVRKKEVQLTSQLNQLKQKAVDNLMGDIKHAEMKLEETKHRQELTAKALQSDVDIDRYEMYKMSKSTNLQSPDEAQGEDRVIHLEYDGTEAAGFLTNLENNTLGEIKPSTYIEKQLPLETQVVKNLDAGRTCVETIDTDMRQQCGLVIMKVGTKRVIVCAGGIFIKSFYHDRGIQNQSCFLLGSPATGLSQIDRSRVVVSIFSLKHIVFFQVCPNLIKESVVETRLGYKAITCLNASTFAAAFESDGERGIAIIDASGTVLRSLAAGVEVMHMCSTTKYILVGSSDYYVRCYSHMGENMFTKDHMAVPFVQNPRDNVFFAVTVRKNEPSSYRQYDTVCEVNINGAIVREIMSIRESDAFVEMDEHGVIFLCQGNKIKVFDFTTAPPPQPPHSPNLIPIPNLTPTLKMPLCHRKGCKNDLNKA